MRRFFSNATGLSLEYDVDQTRRKLLEFLKIATAADNIRLRCRLHIIWDEEVHSYGQALQIQRELSIWERDH